MINNYLTFTFKENLEIPVEMVYTLYVFIEVELLVVLFDVSKF